MVPQKGSEGEQGFWAQAEAPGAGPEEAGGRRCRAEVAWGAGPVHRKGTCSQGKGAEGPQGGGKPGLEPQEQEVSEERWPVGCFGSAFRNSSGLAATFKDLKIWKQALGKRSTENSSREYGKC